MSAPLPHSPLTLRPLVADARTEAALADLLVAVVEEGGSVGFMHPLPRETARAFWHAALASAGRGGRVVLGAYLGGELAGTVSLLLDLPPNQPHRAEVAKMMTRPEFRRRGVAQALLSELERLARAHGRTVLTLDTAEDGGAARLYERRGYLLAGRLPDYALKPHGGLTATLLYWKALGGDAG